MSDHAKNLRKALELITEITTPDKLDKYQLQDFYALEEKLEKLEQGGSRCTGCGDDSETYNEEGEPRCCICANNEYTKRRSI